MDSSSSTTTSAPNTNSKKKKQKQTQTNTKKNACFCVVCIDCKYARIDGTYVSTDVCSLRSVTYHHSLNSSNLLYHNSLRFTCINETTMQVLISNDTVCNSIEYSYIAANNIYCQIGYFQGIIVILL